MKIQDLKTVADYINYVTEVIAPKFTEPFDHYFKQMEEDLKAYNEGKIETIELRAMPEEDAKTFICPTGEYPGLCLEVMYYKDGSLKGYTFFLYKRHTPISPEDGIPAVLYVGDSVCWFNPKERLTLQEIDDTSLDIEILSDPRNYDGPFSINNNGEETYNIEGSSEKCTKEEYENSRLSDNLQLLNQLSK